MKKYAGIPLLSLSVLLLFAGAALAAGDTVVDPDALRNTLGFWLTHSVISTILLILGIFGIVVEIATVGSFGVFGAVGALSFILYFLGALWSGGLSSLSLWLLVGGLVLLALEIFVTPGFGVTGGLGIVAVLAALVIASPNPASAAWSLFIALVVAGVLIALSLKNRKTRKFWGKLVLGQKSDRESGYSAPDPGLMRFLGKSGLASTVLRPAGSAVINGEKVDVVTNGEFIEAGTEVEVVLIEGLRVVVRRKE